MAKTKKQEKSIEQRLEEALVLYEKTPYKLPSNWCWTRLGTVCKLDNGEKINNEELFYLDAKTLRTQSYEQTRKDGVVVEEGQKIILVDGENSGEIFDIPKRGYMGSTFRILDINQLVNEVYVRYFISSNQDKLRNNKIGSAIPHLNKELFFNLLFPFAPFEEQKRIVEIIEKQFAKLDEARDLIQASLDSFADRKSAILHKAFTGELTKQWRENNGRAFSFKRKRFDEVAKIKSNLVEPSEYLDMPHIAPDCIEKFTGKLIGYKTIREDGVFSSKHRCYKNQILYSKIRPNLSKLIIAEFDCLCSADMYPIEANENVKYLFYAMLSSEFLEQASNAGSRSVLPKINQKELSRLFIDIPNIDEQEEIVRILDSIFEKEDKSKELIDMLDKIDEMKKSILARAFRGELGTSNPTDEPAIDLLKKILEQNN